MLLLFGYCLTCTTATSQTQPGSISPLLLSQRIARSSTSLPQRPLAVQTATSSWCYFSQMPSLAAVQKLPTCSLQRIRWPSSLLVGGPTLVHCISLLEISRRQADHSNCRSAKCSGSREGKSSGTTSTLICSALCNS